MSLTPIYRSEGSEHRSAAVTSGSRVLVVDDERGIARFVTDLLRSEGYLADTADSAREALAALATNSFDLLLTDLNMSGMSGLMLLRLRERTTPAILMSASDPGGLLAELRTLNAAWLSKPFSSGELLRLIDAAPSAAWLASTEEAWDHDAAG